MAKDPAFLFYPNDYIGGTMGMTFEEKGAYMELLMMQFNRGHMTTHMIGQTVGQLWVNIQDKFIQDEKGLWYNERLEQEKEKRKTFTESRRNNLEGVNQYTKKKPKKVGHKGGHMSNHMENENENENINKNRSINKKKTFSEFVKLTQDEYDSLLDYYGQDVLDDLIEMLNDYIGQSGKRYKSHKHVLSKNGWVYRKYKENKPKSSIDEAQELIRKIDEKSKKQLN